MQINLINHIKMKKINLLTLMAAIVALTTLNSCKQGENDPFLSLRSRDARIKGLWNLESVTGKYTKHVTTYNVFGVKDNDGTVSREVTLTGGKLKAVNTISGVVQGAIPYTQEYDYTLALDIQAAGICHSKEEITPKGSTNKNTFENDGKWFWANDSKNKNSIIIMDLISSLLSSKIDGAGQFTNWQISSLKNKDLEFTLTAKNTSLSSDKKGQTDFEEEYNFVVTLKQ